MRTKPCVIAALALLLAAPLSLAHAADMAVKAPPPPPPIVSDWTGVYLGLEAGAIIGNAKWTTTCFTSVTNCANGPGPTGANLFFVDSSSPHTFDPASFRGGIYGGYQQQFGTWVAGIEGDVADSNAGQQIHGIVGCVTFCGFLAPTAADIDATSVKLVGPDGSVRGRLGYLFWPNLLLYASGGFAFQGVEAGVNCSPAGPWCTATRSQVNSLWLPGYTIGAGFEWRYTGNWFVRAEYRYSGFTSWNTGFFTGTVDEVDARLHVSTSIATLGLSYKIGGPTIIAH
jgi:outer membrane immunogenic protein